MSQTEINRGLDLTLESELVDKKKMSGVGLGKGIYQGRDLRGHLLPAKLNAFFPQLSIEVKSWESVADREILFAK